MERSDKPLCRSFSQSKKHIHYTDVMRRRHWIAISVLTGIFLVVAICWPQSEPAYHGRPLGFWLRGFESDTMETRWQAAEALRHIGTNALPWLITQLRQPSSRQEPHWRERLRVLLSKQSLIKITVSRPSDRRGEALAALDALGPMAKEAVPVLEELLQENPPDHRALLVLAHVGPEAIPALTRALTHDEKVIRHGARVCLNMRQSHSEFLSPKTPQDAEFMRKTCEFNAKLLRAAFDDYRVQHPEQFSADGTPRPTLPPNFTPPVFPETNRVKTVLPGTRPGYE